MAIGKGLETRMGWRRDGSKFDKSIGIFQYILNNIRGSRHFKIHAHQFALAVGVANTLLVTVPPALITGKCHDSFIGRFCTLAVVVTNTVRVRCASFRLSRSEKKHYSWQYERIVIVTRVVWELIKYHCTLTSCTLDPRISKQLNADERVFILHVRK